MSDDVTVDHHVKKKKRTTGGRAPSPKCSHPGGDKESELSVNVSYSEHPELEGSGKKKKKKTKHRSIDNETFMEIGSSDNLSPSYSHNSFVKSVKQEETLEHKSSNWDCNSNTQKSSKKRKKKKEIEVSVEEADNTGQPNLYDGHFDEASVIEEAPFSESIRKKKKRRRPSETRSLEEDVLEEVEPSPLITLHENINLEDSVRRKKKKKHRPSEIGSLEEYALEDMQLSPMTTLNDNVELEASVRKKKKKPRPSEVNILQDFASEDMRSSRLTTFNNDNIDLENSVRITKRLTEIFKDDIGDETVTEDMSLNGETDLKSTARKKKEISHEIKKVHTRTERSRNDKIFKNSPKQSNKDHARAEEKEEREENVDASEREAFKNITKATNGKADEGTPAKHNKSAMGMKSGRDRKQDVTAELEEPDQDEMENTLDQETSDLQEVNWLKQNKPSVSGVEILCSLPERDVALLEEYFPRIRSLSAKCINELVNNELNRITDAKAKGIKFLTGRFESSEDELIKKNVEDFLKLSGFESGEMLFHSYKFPAKQHMIDQLKKKYNFRQRIAKGLARTMVEVSSRGAKLYDLSGSKGRFTKQEVENLQKLMKVHGNQWTTVARLAGRSSASVQLKASQLKLEVTGGKWDIDEVNRLLEAVKTFIMRTLKRKMMLKQKPYTVPKEMLFTGLPWRQIAVKVQTRNWTHCKSKWNDILLLRMNNGVSPCEGVLGLQTNIEIIKWLYEAKPQKAQVNWVEMANAIGNVPPGILQQKVYKLKSRHVPDWQKMSFTDIVNYMYMELLPVFEAKLEEPFFQSAKEMPEKEDKFFIRDIFREYEGNEKPFFK